MMPFDRRVWAPRERPSTESNNMGQSADRAALDWFYRAILSQRISAGNDRSILRNGFIGDSYKVRALSPAQMKVSVAPGLGYYYDPTVPLVVATDAVAPIYQGVMDLSPYRPLVLPEEVQYTVPTPPAAGQSRYDIIEVRPKRELADYDPILTFNVAALNWLPQAPAAFLRYAIDPAEIGSKIWPDPAADKPMYYVKGVAAATGTQVEPTPTPGYVTVGRILVTNGDVSIAQNRVMDPRTLLFNEGEGFISGVVEIPTTVAATPTMTSLVAPPGVNVVATGLNISGAKWRLSVIGGGPFTSFTGGAHILNGENSDPTIPTLCWGSIINTAGAIPNAGVQTDLADPTKTSPAGPYAIGQRLGTIEFLASRWKPGTQLFSGAAADGLPNPTRYAFWASFTY